LVSFYTNTTQNFKVLELGILPSQCYRLFLISGKGKSWNREKLVRFRRKRCTNIFPLDFRFSSIYKEEKEEEEERERETFKQRKRKYAER
jgi:hypothetical protein